MDSSMIGKGLTGLFALAMLASGGASVTGQMNEAMAHLGYPAYFATILGVWKILGAVALVVPGFPVLRNAAYAGFTFAMTGAFVSHLAVGDAVGDSIAPMVMLTVALGGLYLSGQGSGERVQVAVAA